MRIYIDTSVINGLYIENITMAKRSKLRGIQPTEIKTFTKKFFSFVQKSNSTLYSADLIVKEIDRTPQEAKRNKLKEALAKYEVKFFPFTAEIEKIAHIYIKQGVIPIKYFPDAVHIATAIIHNIPVLVSWNFEHIVKLKTKAEINRINRRYGYPQINISSPKEV